MGFANISRHPVEMWPREQIIAAAEIGGGITDYDFPNIPPDADPSYVWDEMQRVADLVIRDGHEHAMVVGEYAATVALVQILVDCSFRVWMPSFTNGHVIEERGEQRLRTRPFIRFREVTQFIRRHDE